MRAWTPEERLRLITVMLARKRQEAMRRAAPTPLNYESMLMIAVAPTEVLNGNNGGPDSPTVEDAIAEMSLDVSLAPTELFAGIIADVRQMFAPHQWPWWARRPGD